MKNSQNSSNRTMGLVISISSQLSGAMVSGILVGHYMDKQHNTDPLFIAIGLLSGFGFGVYSVYDSLQRFNSQEEKKDE